MHTPENYHDDGKTNFEDVSPIYCHKLVLLQVISCFGSNQISRHDEGMRVYLRRLVYWDDSGKQAEFTRVNM